MGGYLSFARGVLAPIPAPTWTPADMPDLTGAVALVTGGNAGLGFECVKVRARTQGAGARAHPRAQALLAQGATVYIAARSRDKSEAAIAVLKRETGREARFLLLDLCDLASVREAAATFGQQEHRLDILINNA
jgi:retinol dehydrogenase-12